MTTMIEQIALALLNADRVRNGYPPVSAINGLRGEDAARYKSDARAALQSLRNPTEEMLDAATCELILCDDGDDDAATTMFPTASGAKDLWQAMIDTALNEKGE